MQHTDRFLYSAVVKSNCELKSFKSLADSSELGAGIIYIKQISKGKLIINYENSQTKENLKSKLVCKVGTSYNISALKVIKPKLIIYHPEKTK